METQARYTIVGLFTVVIAALGLVFVYWLHGSSDTSGQTFYRIRFDAPVMGLRPGVAVLFNGLRVGQVTQVRFDPAAPKILLAQIAVEAATPVRQDTRVGIDSQGLVGSAAISLTGGASNEPLKPGFNGQPALLVADPDESQSLIQAAKSALGQLEGVLNDNSKPVHDAIGNLDTFSAVLARNAGKVDNILSGLERMTGNSAPAQPPLSYSLDVPSFPVPANPPNKSLGLQIAVPEPTALVAYETQKVLVAPSPGVLQPLEAGQWADSLPKLVQATIVQSFDNAGFAHIAKTTDGFTPEIQLLLDIRSFTVALTPQPEARIEISAKILGADGKIAGTHSFQASAPATAGDTQAATAALGKAFQQVARDIVAWAEETI